jgi:hypothetical protein
VGTRRCGRVAMAKLVLVGMAGFMLGMFGGAACGLHAQPATQTAEVPEETRSLAEQFNLEPRELHAATVTVGTDAPTYLRAEGLLPQPRDWIDRLLECLAWYESRGVASAVNRRSGASGWLQFLPSTFRQTPPGRAGASIFDVAAQRAAGRWMINQGRLREWVTWRLCA